MVIKILVHLKLLHEEMPITQQRLHTKVCNVIMYYGSI